MSHINPINRNLLAKKRAHAETSTRERHSSDRAQPGRERPPVDMGPEDDDSFGSDQERTSRHSSETREGERNYSPPRARPRDGGYGNRNHPERRPTTDLAAERKRRLCEGISLAIKEGNKKKKPAMSNGIESLHHAARFIPRIFGPFLNIHSIILHGVRLDNQSRTPSNLSLTEDEREMLKVYRKILTAIPDLESQVRYTAEHYPSRLFELATYVEATANKGRSDDCSSLRNGAIDYVPRIEDVPHIDRKAKKEQRGFCHYATARLLCPRRLRDEFDADMEGFCRSVQNGSLVVAHDDWPSFLYPESEYNPDALDEHLLRGTFLLSCFRHTFTGPRTGSKTTPGKAPGKKCLADLNDMTKVVPENIAYVAVLCRHVLNAKELWSTQDGNFHADAFFRNIMELFDDQQWAEETLEWWNGQVFGDNIRLQEDRVPQHYNSSVARLAEQRAARRAAAAAATQSGSG